MKKTITADGRLKFPAPLLEMMEIKGSTKVLISTDGEEIVIRKADRICALCHTKEHMIEGFPICRPCAEKAADLLKLT